MIKPTVGRVVWFHQNGIDVPGFASSDPEQPLAAIVTHVWSDRMVNLTVFDRNGASVGWTSVTLLQDDDIPLNESAYAEWMPFQKGQAAKADAVESRAAECGSSSPSLRQEEFQMASSFAWAAKDILATAGHGSDLRRKAEMAASTALARMEQLMLDSAPAATETKDEPQEVAIVGAPTVTAQQIENLIVSAQYHVLPGTTVTICCLTLRNGFNVIGESACASPENFDEAKGRKYARENAFEKVWMLEGYRLKRHLYEQAGSVPGAVGTCASDCSSNNHGRPKLLGPCDCKLVDSAISETPEPVNVVTAVN